MKKRFPLWIIPLAAALITGGIIAWYWIGVCLYNNNSNGGKDSMPDYAGTLIMDESFVVDVVQGNDNSYYLTHDGMGNETKYGCPFIDVQWTKDARNMVIYGHNSLNGTAFSDLVRFRDPFCAAGHETFEFQDKDGILHKYRLACVLDYDTDCISEFNPYALSLPGDYEKRAERFVIYGSGAGIADADRVITLSTCDEHVDGQNGRLIVVGVEEP